MDNEGSKVSDGQTEAIVLQHIKESDKEVQTVTEAATRLGSLNGGRYPITVTSIMLEHLRSCLVELADVYAQRGTSTKKRIRAAAAAFDSIIHSMTMRRAAILRNNSEAGPSAIEFRDTAAIYKAEALQRLETGLSAKPAQLHPYIEKIGIPIATAIIGAVAGSYATYRLTCH